jgi:ABC-type enterochelin transport system permease subunit
MLRYFLFERSQTSNLEDEMNAVLENMSKIGVNSQEYSQMVGYLEKLSEVRVRSRAPRISRDTIALIAGNLAGLIMILIYEQKHVLTTKVLNRTIQPR